MTYGKTLGAGLAMALLLAQPTAANAADFKAGDVTIENPWSRATAGQARNGAAYMMLSAHGAADDRLLGASSPVAEKAELHTHVMDGDVMKMRAVVGIDVTPGSPTELKPGGLHVMLLGLKQPLKQGESFPLTLTFSKAGKVDVQVSVQSAGAMQGSQHMHAPAQGQHKH